MEDCKYIGGCQLLESEMVYHVSEITDWRILTEDGQISPDDIYLLNYTISDSKS